MSFSQNDAFASTSHVLRGTMRRMTTMAKNQGGRWCWFMLFILLCVWFFVIMVSRPRVFGFPRSARFDQFAPAFPRPSGGSDDDGI